MIIIFNFTQHWEAEHMIHLEIKNTNDAIGNHDLSQAFSGPNKPNKLIAPGRGGLAV